MLISEQTPQLELLESVLLYDFVESCQSQSRKFSESYQLYFGRDPDWTGLESLDDE